MHRINIHIQGPSKRRFAQDYLDRLGDLLASHFTSVTGMPLNTKRWFMFNVWDEVQSPQPSVFTVKGDIIGPDSVAYDAEITWQETNGIPVAAGWSQLRVRALQRDYGQIQPPVIPLGAMPFQVEWQAWWDSHLPDFFLDIVFSTVPSPIVVEALQQFIRTLNPAYESVKNHESTLHVSLDFGASAPIREHIVRLMEFVQALHAEHPVTKVSVGVEPAESV